MEYTIPTTKENLYQTLKEIYWYYRLQLESYTEDEPEPLTLTRITAENLSDAELSAKARILLAPGISKRQSEYLEKLNEELTSLNVESDKITAEYAALTEKTAESFEKKKKALADEAYKNGTEKSGLFIGETAKTEKEKNLAIAALNSEKFGKLAAVESKKATVNAKITAAPNYFNDVISQEVAAKKEELSAKQSEILRETLKYNNSLDEKETRYMNALNQSTANRRVKVIEIRSKGFSKEQLVDMGYYSDVFAVVSGFYNTMNPVAAYEDFKNEVDLMEYLDDFYQTILALYRTRAS